MQDIADKVKSYYDKAIGVLIRFFGALTEILTLLFEKTFYTVLRLLTLGVALSFSILASSNFSNYGHLLYKVSFISVTTGMFMAAALRHYDEEFKGRVEDFNFARISSLFVLTGFCYLFIYLISFVLDSGNPDNLNGAVSEIAKFIFTNETNFFLNSMNLALIVSGSFLLSKAVVEAFLSFAKTDLIGTIENVIGPQPSFMIDFYDQLPRKLRITLRLPSSDLYERVSRSKINKDVRMRSLAGAQELIDEDEHIDFAFSLEELKISESGEIKTFRRLLLRPIAVSTNKRFIIKIPSLRGNRTYSIDISEIKNTEGKNGIFNNRLSIETEDKVFDMKYARLKGVLDQLNTPS